MLSFYSVPACKPWGCPENTKGTMGEAPEVQGPATLHSLWTGRTTEAFCMWVEIRLDHSQSAQSHAIEAHTIFICSHFRTQGRLATDCDGSVRHRKWSEPAGTLSWLLPRTAAGAAIAGLWSNRKKASLVIVPTQSCVLLLGSERLCCVSARVKQRSRSRGGRLSPRNSPGSCDEYCS